MGEVDCYCIVSSAYVSRERWVYQAVAPYIIVVVK